MKLDIAVEAGKDLADILRYGREQWGTARAERYAADLGERMRARATGRLSGTSAEGLVPGLRRLVSGGLIIWFRVEAGRLQVLRVLHQSRDTGRWLGPAP